VGGGGREGERRQMVAAMVAKWMFSMGRVFHFLFLFCFFFFFFFSKTVDSFSRKITRIHFSRVKTTNDAASASTDI